MGDYLAVMVDRDLIFHHSFGLSVAAGARFHDFQALKRVQDDRKEKEAKSL